MSDFSDLSSVRGREPLPVDPNGLADRVTAKLNHMASSVVPWFCEQLPTSYFRSTPAHSVESHLEAIIGARASGQPVSVVLKSDEGSVWTVIQDTDRTGLLVSLLDQLPRDRELTSAQVFTARDGSLVLDVFRFGESEADRPVSPLVSERVAALRGDADTSVSLEAVDESSCRLLLVAGGVSTRMLLERGARYLAARSVPIRGAQVHTVGQVTAVVLRVGVPVGVLGTPRVAEDLRRLAWADERAFGLAAEPGGAVSLTDAEVWVALSDLAYHALSAGDPFRFSRVRVFELSRKSHEVITELSRCVVRGLPYPTAKIGAAKERLEGDAADVLEMVVRAAGAIQHHNLRCVGRYGLAFRVDPSFLHCARRADQPVPHATVFFSVAGGMGFHVRFRDIARGGLRVVRPRSIEAHGRESERLYDECWGLAYAQQLKNKDIPEGGSKGVVLAAPEASVDRLVRAVGDGIIDLCLTSESGSLSDRIFLGPDENITDELIVWLVDRAQTRGYPVPNAFMSSKPGAGINHKRYGVTSEGVVVFFEEAMRTLGLDPRSESISVVLTGGPDGDVAGNAIKILSREYGDRVRIVGIADGTGSAEDPNGLPREALLALVRNGLGIAHLAPSALSKTGRVLPLENPGGLVARNTLPFRLAADALLPCGGRPATIHEGNWRDLLHSDGTPRVRAIVEGANLFVTDAARRALDSEAGVLVVKDSSANKCGVVCSSFEIAAAHLVDASTFLDIKDRFVEEVLVRLRSLARREARLLFRTRARRAELPLAEISILVSRTINRVSDAVERTLDSTDAPEVRALYEDYLPKTLREATGSLADAALPSAYLARTVATSLSGDIVYREGLAYVQGLDEVALARLTQRYLVERARVQRLAAAVRSSDLSDRHLIADLLLGGGVRAAVER